MKKTAHVTTATLLLFSLTLGSCGKNTTTREIVMMPAISTEGTSQAVTTEMKKSNLEAWRKLVLSDDKNIALAELLSPVVAQESQADIKELVMALSDKEIEFILSQVQDERDALKRSYLFRQNTGLLGSSLYQKSILFEDYKADSEVDQMRMATFSYLKSKSLEEIYQSFNKIIDENSKDIARAMIVEIGKNNPALADEIEKTASQAKSPEEFSKKMQSSKKYLEQANAFFEASGLNTQEQLMLIATGAVGGFIYTEVKDSKTFLMLMQKYKDIKVIVEDVKEKINQIKVAVAAIKESKEKMEGAYEALNIGLQTVGQEIKDTYESVKNSDSPNAKKMASMLYENVVNGKKLPNTANASILASQENITKGLNLTFQAAGVMANSLNDIISTTRALSTALGVKLPKGLEKALNTASKVAIGVKAASAAIAAFATGGVLAAVGAISGPLGSMLGLGGGPDPAIMAALGRIEAKLDAVLENQKKMLEMQIETITMIKNVAVMIDEYHRKEMNALASLHDDVMLANEIGKASLNANIRSCEQMIEFELSKYWKDYERNARTASTTTEFDFDRFYSNLKTMEDFRRFTRGTSGDAYLSCQRGLASAFGSITSDGNPILGVYNSSDDKNILAFQRDIYSPLIGIYSQLAKGSGEVKKILHVPVANVSSLDLKTEYLVGKNGGASSGTGNRFGYSLNKMISPMSLERYFSSLSILYPIFEFNEKEWDLTLSEIVDAYFRITSKQNGKISRGYYFMSNALDLIQSAIAQEAMLAGETIIPTIKANLAKDVFTTANCISSEVCAIRSNKLLMKNYLNYVILKNLYSMESNAVIYKNALEEGNTAVLAKFLELPANQVGVLKVDGDKVVSVSLKGLREQEYSVQLPSIETVKEGKMIYSENMPRLLKMQEEAISSLVKLSPSQFRTVENRIGLANLLLLKEF